MIRQSVLDTICNATINQLGKLDQEIDLVSPSTSSHGDYATSIALKLAKVEKKNPLEIANFIAKKIQPDELIEKVEVASPGFINIFLTKKVLLEELSRISQKKEQYGKSNIFNDKKILVEYTDPNPFKEFHIGHLYSNIIGESLSRILESAGAQVKRVNYFGDIGMHVAKSVWGIKKKLEEEKLTLVELEKKSLDERVKFLGLAYTKGTTAFESDETAKKEIVEINRKIFAKDKEVMDVYLTGKEWSLNHFEEVYIRLGNNNGKGSFDAYYPESEVGDEGANLVKNNIASGFFEESKGAIIFPGEKYGLHNRVFINSQGFPTYEAKELGLAPRKYKDFQYDLSIVIAGNEILEYFKVLIEVLRKINPEIANKTRHIAHGMVRLPEGKMSSRSGNIIPAEQLLDDVRKKALDKINEVTHANDVYIGEKVGISAVKYSLLKSKIGDNIEFDINSSVSFEGNSGPYLLYTYVRCQSILGKTNTPNALQLDFEINDEERILLRKLSQYPEILDEAVKNYSPHFIATYLYDLAKDFNFFYQKHSVLKADENTKQFRLSLIQAISQIIKNGLYLLGIETVDKM